MTAALMEFIQLCQSEREELILEISIILGQLWKYNTVLWRVLALENNLHTFTPSCTECNMYLCSLQTSSVTRLLFALLLNCLCPCYLMNNCEF